MSKFIEPVKITEEEEKVVGYLQSYYNRTFGKNAEYQMTLDFTERKIGWVHHPSIRTFWHRLSLEEFTLIFIHKYYEIEKSKEEKLLEFYNNEASMLYSYSYGGNIIKKTLNILGIKVKGINA
jgi:hypothetical protein